MWTWGDGWAGVSAQNSSTLDRVSSPVQIGSDTTWNKINRVPNAAYAIKTDGTLWAWGVNAQGNLAQNDVVHYSSPVQIPGTTWVFPVAIYNVMYATKTDGTLWATGRNALGQLGQNSRQSPGNHGLSSPVQIPGTWPTDVGLWNGASRGNHVNAFKKD